MNDQRNIIRVLFTVKATASLDDIINKFGLEETPEDFIKGMKEGKSSKIVTINNLIRSFFKGDILEKDLPNSLKNELGVPQWVAEQISREIIVNIVPYLEKAPEEKFKDPAFVDEISKKVFGEPAKTSVFPAIKQIDGDIFPTIKPIEDELKQIEKKIPDSIIGSPKNKINAPPKKIKKLPLNEPIIPAKTQQPSGPDSYREPIE